MKFRTDYTKLLDGQQYLIKYKVLNDYNIDLAFYNKSKDIFQSDSNITPSLNVEGFISVEEMLPENRIQLGKKGFWYYVQLIFLTPFWLSHDPRESKPWAAFKSGLIKHKHEFDFDHPSYDNEVTKRGKHYKCKHFGCNLVEVKNPDGTWC